MVNRRTIVAAVAAVLFCTTITNDALAAPFQPGDFITYSQDSWGNPSGPAGNLLVNNFNLIYQSDVEMGISGAGGVAALFTSASDINNYLPTTSAPGPLNSDHVNPTSTSSGVFGGHVLALQLDVDFSDAGFLSGSTAIPVGDLVLHNLSAYSLFNGSLFNGLSVRHFLLDVHGFLGGIPPPFSYDDISALTQDLSLAFEGGTPSQFAQDHLRVVSAPVPEPATLGLLGIGLATLTARRFNRKRPESPSR